MTKSIIINSESFQDNITEFETSVKNVADYLEKINNQMDKIDGTNELWKSKVALEMHNDHIELKKKFEKVNTELSGYVTFLKNTLQKYKDEETSINNKIENNSSDLDVNE